MTTAQDQMRKMLDQLMGQDRDGGNQHANLRFTDKEVCRPFLLDICINELFINTRADVGECNKIHSLALRSEYEKASAHRDYEFEEEVLQCLQSFIRDNERKIELAKKRLEMQEKNPELEAKAQVVHELGVQIGEKVAKSETLGAEGKVDESLAVLAEVETLKTKKKDAEDDYRNSVPFNAQQQQQLRACEVCGAFLSLYDNDRRLADHFGGKLHMGYVTIRERIKLLEELVEEKAKTRRAKLEERRNRKEASPSRERRRSRSRSRERRRRSRSRDRDPRDRDRRRERVRRSRSKEKETKSTKDSRKHRSRSRERKDRNQDRKRSRSRSKERKRSRSRSKERRQSKS